MKDLVLIMLNLARFAKDFIVIIATYTHQLENVVLKQINNITPDLSLSTDIAIVGSSGENKVEVFK